MNTSNDANKILKLSKLHEWFSDDWCTDLSSSEVLIRIYTIIGLPAKEFIKRLQYNDKRKFSETGYPVWILGLPMSFSKLATLDLSFLYSDPENGSIKIPSKLNEYDLPESCYLLIGTPIKVDGDALGEPQVKQRLNRFEATFTVNFGKNALHKKVFEAVIRPNKDEYSFVSNIVRTPSKHDGPNINKRTWDNFHEILRALEALKDSTLKSKIHRALECHQQALSCPDGENDSKFFFYWTAITVLSGQGTLRTNEKIQKIYDVSKEHVEKVFLWKNIVTVRNNYFKEGKKVNFNQDEERYLQLIFLDLLRHQLQLTPLNAIEYGICNLDLSGFQ